MNGIEISEKLITGLKAFMRIDDKNNIIKALDEITEISIKSGFAKEYDLGQEIGLLFDIKRLINELPF